jgi:glutathione S-transferase
MTIPARQTEAAMIYYHSYLSPYARRVLIALEEKGLKPEKRKHVYAREFDGLKDINPCLMLPVLVDGEMTLWGSNLILEYLIRNYPNSPSMVEPEFAKSMTRPEHHWTDSRILATIETMTDSIMNLRQMKMSGVEADEIVYLKRQRYRIDVILDWLESQATIDGFAPGIFSIMDLNLICALGNIDNRKSFEWRGRPTLEAIYSRYASRPSVKLTATE